MNIWRSRLRRAAVAVRKAVHQIPADDEMASVEQRDAVVRALQGAQSPKVIVTGCLDAVGLLGDEGAI